MAQSQSFECPSGEMAGDVQRIVRVLLGASARQGMISDRRHLEEMALRVGLSSAHARAWARSPGSAGRWTPQAIDLVTIRTSDVAKLDRLVIQVEIGVACHGPVQQPARPRPARSRPRRARLRRMVKVAVIEKNEPLRGERMSRAMSVALTPVVPSRLLRINDEVDRAGLPKGYSTSDWLGSKS